MSNVNAISGRGFMASVAALCLASVSVVASAQTPRIMILQNSAPDIETTFRAPLVSGTHQAIRFHPAGLNRTILTARGNRFVQCFSPVRVPAAAGSYVTFDQNRPYSPRMLTLAQAREYGVTLEAFGRSGEGFLPITANEPVRLQGMNYIWHTNVFDERYQVAAVDIAGGCYAMPEALMVPDPAPPVCSPVSAGPGLIRDELFVQGFDEAFNPDEGTLKMAVEINPDTISRITSYTYTFWAEDGPVHNIRLREQFPFYEDLEPFPVYEKSMRLEHLWTCQADGEADCGRGQKEAIGVGFARVDGARLDTPLRIDGELHEGGSCLKVTVNGRTYRQDGQHVTGFSGLLTVSALYDTWHQPANNYVIKQNSFLSDRRPFTEKYPLPPN
ncbi:MAG: hypothetical protein WCZ02_01490 [Lysobacterales bacterium]